MIDRPLTEYCEYTQLKLWYLCLDNDLTPNVFLTSI